MPSVYPVLQETMLVNTLSRAMWKLQFFHYVNQAHLFSLLKETNILFT